MKFNFNSFVAKIFCGNSFFENHLSQKYGKTYIKKIRTDPIIDDLLYFSKCYAIKTGIEEITIIWRLESFEIELALYGDEDDDLLIAITYRHKALWKKTKNKNKRALLERL